MGRGNAPKLAAEQMSWNVVSRFFCLIFAAEFLRQIRILCDVSLRGAPAGSVRLSSCVGLGARMLSV